MLLLASWLMLIVLSGIAPMVWAQYDAAPESYFLTHQGEVTELRFDQDSTTSLQGKWQFYPRQFIERPDPELESQSVKLPASFKTLTGTNATYGTFISHFKIPKEFIGHRLALHIPSQYGAYSIYLNGDILLHLGEISKTPEGQVTERLPKITSFVPQNEYFTLSIQVSNYTHLHGGLEKPLKIGPSSTISRQFMLQMMSIAAVCGTVLGVGLFTILFSMFRGSVERNSRSVFIFGLFIIFLALHNLFSAPHPYAIVTKISWLWGARLEYLFTFLAILFFLSYMHLFKPRYIHRSIYFVGAGLLIFNMAVTLFSTPEVFEPLALYCTAYGLVIIGNFIYGFYVTLSQGEEYSRTNLFAVIFLCLTFLNDYLVLLNVIESVHLSFISTSLYALIIMFQQSSNYAHHTYYTERLNYKLMALNSSLDQKVRERTEQLHELNAKLEYQSKVDALTGAYNRRALNEEIQRLFNQTIQHPEQTLTFAMIDVDYFKKYNDYYGHLKGDEVLQRLVQVIQYVLPEQGYLARYGGEEFAILLHDMPIAEAREIFELVLVAVRAEQLEHDNRDDEKDYVTVSIGVAYMDVHHPYPDIHILMKTADQHLYEAKLAGRDQMKSRAVAA
ncbi:histidine kinase [Acinetobacter sp. LoGeW2-3]|uniref:sensor domain-containing diguanylate cyclase n=1 Tax=Acinetobacter sp. LoGeW2-3 TaxID=1808001 RepID=UPI000C05B899|nr:diguanylate cyclase [Acinetobacter sp. LoGeW2-3]ATO19774.1 histidine kinase [Acinetobacter sp. LoGeW2-3]